MTPMGANPHLAPAPWDAGEEKHYLILTYYTAYSSKTAAPSCL